MEDFEKIKEITLKEAKEILPQDIAYLTMNDGEIIIVNGLDHNKFNQREKEYESYIEELSKYKSASRNIENPLQKIQEDTEENERNSNLLNQEKNLNNNNIKINLNQRYYNDNLNNNIKREIAPFPSQNENNSFYRINNQYNNHYIPNNNLQNQYYNNPNNQIKYINQYPRPINYGNTYNRGNPIGLNQVQNDYSQYYIKKPNNIQYTQRVRPNTNRKREFDHYVCYNNHSYLEVKQTK